MKTYDIITEARGKPFSNVSVIWVFDDELARERARKSEKPRRDVKLFIVKNGYIEKDLSKYDLPKVFVEVMDVHNLQSLKGLPNTVDYLSGAAHSITTLEGAPMVIKDGFSLYIPKVHSLEGIGRKYITECHQFQMSHRIRSNILGILLIKNLTDFRMTTPNLVGNLHYQRNKQASLIVKKHLAGDRDVLDCQEELIKAGFQEYAKL